MNFIDEIEFRAFSGKGGDGVVRWNRTRSNQKGGPNGGNGGKGGDVLIRAVRDIALLGKYRSKTTFKAGDGEAGGGNSLHGHDGDDVTIDLPIGSIVKVESTEKTFELLKEGEVHVVLKGGIGGLGNEHFKSSRNVKPMQATEGKSGSESILTVELRIIADLGLVGYPNVGKTSLLNTITNARAKVGNYAFTTLDPNLGDLFGHIIADIPGLIEGASEGRGLGHKFLKHINRTKTLIFCISVEQDDPISAQRALMAELVAYDPSLAQKPRVAVLTKADLVDAAEIESLVASLRSAFDEVFAISIYDDASVKTFVDGIVHFVETLDAS